MTTILKDIQETVTKYAKIIAHVIKVDVEIVDENLIRIAGTGVYKAQINEDMSAAGFVYKAVLETGEPQFIPDPGKHALCRCCPKKLGCGEKLEMCTPIKLDNRIIGVIGLICFSEAQKEHLLQDLSAFRDFLVQIADFISAKAREQREVERALMLVDLLNQVINTMTKGVLVLNNRSEIVHINGNAVKQLQVTPHCLHQPILLEATGDSVLDLEEFKVTIEGRKFALMGHLVPVRPQVADYADILIFDEIKNVKSEIYDLTSIAEEVSLADIVGNSAVMRQLKNKILKVAASNSTILVTGESGTGKEMIARAIHQESSRHDKPFVAINCGAIPDTLLESELFGYVRGAFTGADPRGKIGKFELANKGVIFLDEIGDMPLYLQVKLLRVLQERKITRIGSNQQLDIDIRVIAATNKNLSRMIEENKFREDLYYRLNVIPVEVPPLRERREDIELLVAYMIKRYSSLFGKRIAGIDQPAMQELMAYSWPGNIRELENTIEFMINMVDDGSVINQEALPGSIRAAKPVPAAQVVYRPRTLQAVERELIEQALRRNGATTEGKKQAARELGIGIATFYRKLDKYQLS